MNIENKLEILKKITPVDAPPFLLTRIQERLRTTTKTVASTQWQITFVLTSIIMLVLNIGILLKVISTTKETGMDTVANAMHISTTNDIYNE